MSTRQSKIIKTVGIKPLELTPNDYKSLGEVWGDNLSQDLKSELGQIINIYRKTLPIVRATTPASVKKSLLALINVNLNFLSRAIDQETDERIRPKIDELVEIANARIEELDGLGLSTSTEASRALKESLIILFRGCSPNKHDKKCCLKFVCKVFDIAEIERPDWENHPKRFWG